MSGGVDLTKSEERRVIPPLLLHILWGCLKGRI
nr:MAG TPA: hypothetical protein [Caudoviricetes sp.]